MSWGDPQVPRAYTQDAPTLMGPRRLRELGLRPPDWISLPRDVREPWEMCAPEEIDAWVAQDAERVMLKRKVAASLAWLDATFGGKR